MSMACRVCGCSQLDPCEGGCAWAAPGLCTNCLAAIACPRCFQRDCTSRGGLLLCLPKAPAALPEGLLLPDGFGGLEFD
jgi:hypothetical protein